MTQVIAWAFALYGIILFGQTIRRAVRTRGWTIVSYGTTMATLGCWSIAAADLVYGSYPQSAQTLFVGVGFFLLIAGHGIAWYFEKKGVDQRPALR